MISYRQALLYVERQGARITEQVRVNGSLRLNIVLPDGRPQTLKVRA